MIKKGVNLTEQLIVYTCFLGWGFYGILIVPYIGAKILSKTGESERFWFFILVILNIWALLFIVIRPRFRIGLTKLELITIISLIAGYIVFFSLILVTLQSV